LAGVTQVPLVLSMACFGVSPGDPRSTCDPATGTLVPEPILAAGDPAALPAPGSFPGAARVDCSAAPPPGMICVRGGLFLMGYARAFPDVADALPVPEHAVLLSPFALDVDEMTIKVARPYLAGLSSPLNLRDTDARKEHGACSYIGPSIANDDLPLNCVTYDQAAAICKAQGKRLPTEAEWEFAARGETVGSTYPWGEAADVCNRAIVGRGRTDFETYPYALGESSICRTAGSKDVLPWGLVPGGDPLDDVTPSGLHNLGGSVSEYVFDAFAGYDEACWKGPPILTNPHCDVPGKDGYYVSVRGGAWSFPPLLSKMYERDNLPYTGASVRSTLYLSDIGFRCATSM
jgi:formylglycine-generating enzyme required for sulfatase activity